MDCSKCGIAPSCKRVWKGRNDTVCIGFTPIRTRADTIRSSTDEELAEILAKHGCFGEECPYFPRVCLDVAPKEVWLKWLKQEIGAESQPTWIELLRQEEKR